MLTTIMVYGAAIFIEQKSTFAVKEKSVVMFYDNKARYGGAVACRVNSSISLQENSNMTFINNNAESGGATSFIDCTVVSKGQSVVTFTNNTALHGGEHIVQAQTLYLWRALGYHT